jgi:hypothetical protein
LKIENEKSEKHRDPVVLFLHFQFSIFHFQFLVDFFKASQGDEDVMLSVANVPIHAPSLRPDASLRSA